METKICKKCGRENYIDMKFCSGCGNPFSKSEEAFKFCPECGAKNQVSERFCGECGASLNGEVAVEKENVTSNLQEDLAEEEPVIVESVEESVEDEYIFCSECGTKNQVSERFCEECGASLSGEAEEEKENVTSALQENLTEEEPVMVELVEKTSGKEEKYIFCPECGVKNQADEKFCEECGVSLSEETVEGTEYVVNDSQKDLIEENISTEEVTLEEENVIVEPQKETVEDEQTAYIFCPKCGTKNQVGERFCEECGASLGEDVEEENVNGLQEDLIEEEPIEKSVIKVPTEEEHITETIEDAEDKSSDEKELVIEEEKEIVKPLSISENSAKSEEKLDSTNKKTVPKKKPFNKKIIIVIGIVLILAIAGGVCYKTGIIDDLLSKKPEAKTETKKNEWSSWSEKLPSDIDEEKYVIEEKVQYSKQTKKTKTSNKKTLKGWTLYETENAPESQTEIVNGVEEIKKFEAKKDIDIISRETTKEKYTSVLCGYYTIPKDKNRFYSPVTSEPYCREDDSYSLTEESDERASGTYKIGDNYQEKSYTNTDGNPIYYKVIKVVPVEVKFTYQESSKDTVYHFYQWSKWSKYDDKEIKEDENTKVKTRTVYRYKKKTK